MARTFCILGSKADQSIPQTPLTVKDGAMPQRRILIVEDSEANRHQLRNQLLQADAKVAVDTVRDGTEALEALVEHHYSIVITDLKMPHLNGMQLIEEVQNRRLPVTVIVTTGYGSVDDAVQAMRLGAYDFLTKPINTQHLRVVVQRTCASGPCKMKLSCCASNSRTATPSIIFSARIPACMRSSS